MDIAIRQPWRLENQGDRTLMLRLDQAVNVQTGRQCAAVAAAVRQAGLAGVVDVVPSFNAVAVHCHPGLLGAHGSFQDLAAQVAHIVDHAQDDTSALASREVSIPVCYGGEFGRDLADVAAHCGVSQDEVIALHATEPAYVFMLGFAPGAAYIGMHDPALDISRRATPRTALPKGAVAIANRQTIIYPNVSPGGWHVIGTTPQEQFFPDCNPPTLLAPGDTVRFVPISPDEFAAYSRHAS